MDSIYGEHEARIHEEMDHLTAAIEEMREVIREKSGMDPVEHLLSRVKSDSSMREKCRRKNYPETTESAIQLIRDAIGIRIVCSFRDDVYRFRDAIQNSTLWEVVEEKDYIKHVKPNGYRSLHMILRLNSGYFAEIQLRTISMDTWAALEHHMKYKKTVGGNIQLIVEELKRCADELASTDISMQTIRNMIMEES